MHNADIVRVVQVGCGGMSGVWLDAATSMPDVKIVGLVDIMEDAARRRAEQYKLQDVVIGTDLKTVLQRTSPDAVFDCTIPEAHYEVTMEALHSGCHVLGEKPLADSMEHARAIIAAAEQAGKIFAVIQNRRYHSQIRRLKDFLLTGTLGPLTTVNSDFYIGVHFGGFRDHMQHVLLLDMAIHTFDAVRLLTGADPIAVYCKEWNPPGSWYDHDASAVALFEMTNDIVYTYRGSWCSNGLPTSWESDWRFVGQRGSVKWDGGGHFAAQVVATTGSSRSPYQDIELPPYHPTHNVGGHASLIREFIDCIQNGTQPETNGADNIKSLAMVLGAIESAETGQHVNIQW